MFADIKRPIVENALGRAHRRNETGMLMVKTNVYFSPLSLAHSSLSPFIHRIDLINSTLKELLILGDTKSSHSLSSMIDEEEPLKCFHFNLSEFKKKYSFYFDILIRHSSFSEIFYIFLNAIHSGNPIGDRL